MRWEVGNRSIRDSSVDVLHIITASHLLRVSVAALKYQLLQQL